MSRNGIRTRRDLIDPVFLNIGWNNDLIKVEVTTGGTDIIYGKPKRRKVRSDYLLFLPELEGYPPYTVAILEAVESLPAAILSEVFEFKS